MTISDPVTESHQTSQQSSPTASPRRGVVLHHGATTSADNIINMMVSGSRTVSAHRVVKDKRCAKVVDATMRAYSLGSPYWDSVLRSIECANESTAGWTISADSHETLAQQTAFWALQDGFWPHRNGKPETWTVFGHREIYQYFGDSYATVCPGGMNLNLVTNRAQELLTDIEKKVLPMSGDLKYIVFTEDPKNRHYAVVNTDIDGGFMRTKSLDVARTYSILASSADGAPRYCPTLKVFEDTLKLAVVLHEQAKAGRAVIEVGNVTVAPDAALLAAVSSLGGKIDALPAEIDRYSDGRKNAS